MTASCAEDTSKGGEARGKSSEQEWRPPRAEFLSSFSELDATVRKSCNRESSWEAQVSAGVVAALEFVDSNPGAAHALTIDARRKDSDRGSRQDDVIRHFGELLRERIPADRRGSVAIADGIVESIAVMVRGQLISPKEESLTSRAADVVFLTLVAFVDTGEASRWAERLERAAE